MFLIDMNQISIASIMMQNKMTTRLDLNQIRYMILNSIRLLKKKFQADYGDMILCYDYGKSWRHDIFPYYKQNRQNKKNTEFWIELKDYLYTIKKELNDYFPYIVLQVKNAEADDIIAVLAKHSEQCENRVEKDLQPEPCLIVSSDKDYKQLQRYSHVEQYNPRSKEKIVCKNPLHELYYHIISGDSSDGIPNILSDDDTFFIPKKRQKKLTKNKIEEFLHGIPKVLLRNFHRNEQLIDFKKIPTDIENAILNELYIERSKEKVNHLIGEYFRKHGELDDLFSDIGDYYINHAKKQISNRRN